MIYNISKPDISPTFTTDDIHKIREWHYEQLKDATVSHELGHADVRTTYGYIRQQELSDKSKSIIYQVLDI